MLKPKDQINEIRTALVECEFQLTEVGKPIMERAATLKLKLSEAYKAGFDADEVLQSGLKALEASKALTSVPHDEFYHRWVRVDLNHLIDAADAKNTAETLDQLGNYLADHAAYFDAEHSTLTTCEGPALIINDDGDAYDQDSGKIVVNHTDYTTTAGRNRLIETWMLANGYFPSVIKVDRYGEPVGYVNTQSRKAGAK